MRVLTRPRIVAAFTVALVADAIQLMLGPLGWAFLDEIIDVVAMIAVTLLLGFHPLLLPTFIIELVPVADMLPTWTGCVAIVIMLRKRQHAPTSPSANAPSSKVIDVEGRLVGDEGGAAQGSGRRS